MKSVLLLLLLVLPQAQVPWEEAPIPFPSSSEFEDTVREQLDEGRARVEALSADDPPETRFDALFSLGRLYHAYELYDAAAVCYQNALIVDQKSLTATYYLADVRHARGDYEAAKQLYIRILSVSQDEPTVLVRLAEIALAQERLEDAASRLNHAADLKRNWPAIWARQGEVALARDEPERAVELLERALEAVPEADRLHYHLGMAWRALGEMDKAREHLAKRGVKGIALPDPRLDELQDLATGERVHLLRGRRAFQAGDYESAVEAFREALKSDPDSVRVRVNLGSALGQTGRTDEAIEQFQQVVKEVPDNLTAHYNLAVLLAARDPEAALPHLRRVVQATPNDEDARMREAVLLVEIGRYEEAKTRLTEASAALPTSGRIALALARLLAGVPDHELRDGARALELAQAVYAAAATAEHAVVVASALAELGRCEEAADWQKNAVDALGEQSHAPWEDALRRYLQDRPCN